MNWAQANKFLTGFIVVMVIGVGALGFEVFSARSALVAADDLYRSKATEYNRLRRLVPYPSVGNLREFEKQKQQAAEAVTAFQTELAKREFPLEPITPEQFQDRLKNSVTAVLAKARESNTTITDAKFYLGFGRYETQPPDKDAATPLGRQLKAIEWVVQQCLASRVTELRDLKRPELPEEKGKAAAASRPAERPRTGADRGERGGEGCRPRRTGDHTVL